MLSISEPGTIPSTRMSIFPGQGVIPRRVRTGVAFGSEPSSASIIISPLDGKRRSPKSSSPIAPSGDRHSPTGRPLFGRPLYPYCSTEDVVMRDFDLTPNVAVDRRGRSPVRPHRRFASFAGRGKLPALQHAPRRGGPLSHLARSGRLQAGEDHRHGRADQPGGLIGTAWPQNPIDRFRGFPCRGPAAAGAAPPAL